MFLNFCGNPDIVKGLHCTSKARISLLVDLRDFFSDLGSGMKKKD